MKTSTLTKTVVLFLFTMLISLSCKKSSSDDSSSSAANEQATITLAASATASENLYDDTFNTVLQSGEQSNVNVATTNQQSLGAPVSYAAAVAYNNISCAVITLSPSDASTFPKTMTIDYGTGCTSASGVRRAGKLIVTLSGKIREAGTTISVTYSGYSINGYKLSGTYTFTSNSTSAGGINYTVTVTSGSVTYPTGAVYTYSGSETFTQTAGTGTTTVTDDSYSISGNFASTGPGGAITGTIVNPLVVSYGCKNITSGTIDFVFNGIKAVLDYGSGTCDNQATLTAGLTTKTMSLPF